MLIFSIKCAAKHYHLLHYYTIAIIFLSNPSLCLGSIRETAFFCTLQLVFASVAALAPRELEDAAAGRPADFATWCGTTESGGCLAARTHGDSKGSFSLMSVWKEEVREDVLAVGSKLNGPCHWLSRSKTRHKRAPTHTHALTHWSDGISRWTCGVTRGINEPLVFETHFVLFAFFVLLPGLKISIVSFKKKYYYFFLHLLEIVRGGFAVAQAGSSILWWFYNTIMVSGGSGPYSWCRAILTC